MTESEISMIRDVEIRLPDHPGALADLGETLGAAGVSLEGGGCFTHDGAGIAHFLVDDGPAAARAWRAGGFDVVAVREVVTLFLDQDTPGQLGLLCREMARAGVNIEVQYSDHDHRLVLVIESGHEAAAYEVAAAWQAAAGRGYPEAETRAGGNSGAGARSKMTPAAASTASSSHRGMRWPLRT